MSLARRFRSLLAIGALTIALLGTQVGLAAASGPAAGTPDVTTQSGWSADSGLSAAAAAAPMPITITGHGRGHGRGMGQYGAYGYAVNYGWTYQQILAHYYGGTQLTTPVAASGQALMGIRLLYQDGQNLRVTASGVGFQVGGAFWFTAGQSATLIPEVGGFGVYQGTGCSGAVVRIGAVTSAEVAAATVNPGDDLSQMLTVCYTEADGSPINRTYRGLLQLLNLPGVGLRTVNTVYLNDYVRGVIPRESPASWGFGGGGKGMEALKAQAVAAKSYALAETRYSYAKTCDTDACQVYGGAGLNGTLIEHPNTNAAAFATSGQALTWPDGSIVRSEFASASGGWSIGGSFPQVEDLGDAVSINPYHNWTLTRDVSTLGDYYGVGTLLSLRVTARDGVGADGGRVVSVEVAGTTRTITVTGDSIRIALSLWSKWFVFVDQPSVGSLVPVDPGTGAPIADTVVEIRDPSCSRTFSVNRSTATGFPVTAMGGIYCAVVTQAPMGYSPPPPITFVVPAGATFGAYLPLNYGAQLGQLTALNDGARVPGAVFQIRNGSCGTVFSTNVTNALGSFFIRALPGTYCAVAVSVPAGNKLPPPTTFTVTAGQIFNVAVDVTLRPSVGSLRAVSGGAAVAGAVFQIRNAGCGTVFSTMVTDASGSIPITAWPGTYCAVPVSVPAGYAMPAATVFSVPEGPFTASVEIPPLPVSGQLLATGGGAPLPGVTVAIRDGSCTRTFSTMTTQADGAFSISAFPGSYCAVPIAVPAGYQLPAPQPFLVTAPAPFVVNLAVPAG